MTQIKMDIVTRLQLEIAMQLILSEIRWHIRQAMEKANEFLKLQEN